MKLFLASSMKDPHSMAGLTKYVGGLEDKKIAYIPTASHAEDGFDVWKTGGSWKTVNEHCKNLTPILLEDYRSEEVIEKLKGADIIWFAGGLPAYLLYWIRQCRIDTHLDELLKGKVYVGSSAGAMILNKTLHSMEIWRNIDMEPSASYTPGLGIVDFDVYPHYEDKEYDYIKEVYKGDCMYLMKDGDYIIVENGEVTTSRDMETV